MATLAHCAYCFETLSARLEKFQPLSLEALEDLWSRYHLSLNDTDDARDQQMFLGDATAEETSESEAAAGAQDKSSAKPAAISRLLANTPSTASSSVPSAASSTPSLNTSNGSADTPATSNSSSRSSFFSSLPGKLTGKTAKRRSASQAAEYPLFVTWDIRGRNGNKNLRGCIGTFEPHALDEGLRSYALTSALEDSRFMPISHRELPMLECSVTLLTDFEPVSDPMDWEVGKHGLRINFVHHGRRYGATYLPDVAPEQGWTKEETIVSLMRKAGWTGRKDEWRKVGAITVVRYQGQRSSLTYTDWREFHDWVDETGRGESD